MRAPACLLVAVPFPSPKACSAKHSGVLAARARGTSGTRREVPIAAASSPSILRRVFRSMGRSRETGARGARPAENGQCLFHENGGLSNRPSGEGIRQDEAPRRGIPGLRSLELRQYPIVAANSAKCAAQTESPWGNLTDTKRVSRRPCSIQAARHLCLDRFGRVGGHFGRQRAH